jgi:hypothetical protein
LEERPVTIGAAWARAVCDSISREGRVIAGGWPGTIVEARARIANHLHGELSERRMKALEPEELEQAANVTYSRAKQEWLEAERRSKRAARPAAREDD